MTGSIVCGVGGSDSGKRAVRLARNLGGELGLRLVFVRVVRAGSADDEISALAERLERLSECTTDVDCGAGWLVAVGDPVERLVDAAVDEDARLLVVGSSRPHSPLSDSIGVELARRAPCPVVVVPLRGNASGDGHGRPGHGRPARVPAHAACSES